MGGRNFPHHPRENQVGVPAVMIQKVQGGENRQNRCPAAFDQGFRNNYKLLKLTVHKRSFRNLGAKIVKNRPSLYRVNSNFYCFFHKRCLICIDFDRDSGKLKSILTSGSGVLDRNTLQCTFFDRGLNRHTLTRSGGGISFEQGQRLVGGSPRGGFRGAEPPGRRKNLQNFL